MPLARISHIAGKPDSYSRSLSKVVHSALIDAFQVPEDDYFQIVTEHARKDGIIGPQNFLGIKHTDELVFVQITCAEGRTLDQKKALYKAISENAARDTGVRQQDVVINLVETAKENWSFGNGDAPFAS